MELGGGAACAVIFHLKYISNYKKEFYAERCENKERTRR